jgi:hypothetical protein
MAHKNGAYRADDSGYHDISFAIVFCRHSRLRVLETDPVDVYLNIRKFVRNG